ncbi:MAG: hypothetical protein KBS81_07680 [Spirochaetales bacterium]|nr:hypothetical protein [Candidatus Physcosoma equi]
MNTFNIILASFYSSPLFNNLLERIRTIVPGSPVSSIYEALLPWSRDDSAEMGICVPLIYDDEKRCLYAGPEDEHYCWKDIENLPTVKVLDVTPSRITLEAEPSFFNFLVLQELSLRNGADIIVDAPGRFLPIEEELRSIREFAFGLHDMDYIHGENTIEFRHRA